MIALLAAVVLTAVSVIIDPHCRNTRGQLLGVAAIGLLVLAA